MIFLTKDLILTKERKNNNKNELVLYKFQVLIELIN